MKKLLILIMLSTRANARIIPVVVCTDHGMKTTHVYHKVNTKLKNAFRYNNDKLCMILKRGK